MENNKIQKPLTIKREEFINTITEACNNAELPFFIIEDVLNHIIPIVSNAAKEQYKIDKEQYEQALQLNENTEKRDINDEQKKT